MNIDPNEAVAAAEAAARGPFGGLLHGLADRLGVRANASAAFGAPVERDGVTVIPVAKVRWGFGGGGGVGPADDVTGESEGEGSGGGGGVTASPLGYIEISGGKAEFKRIPDVGRLVPVILAGGFTTWLVLRGLRKLLR